MHRNLSSDAAARVADGELAAEDIVGPVRQNEAKLF